MPAKPTAPTNGREMFPTTSGDWWRLVALLLGGVLGVNQVRDLPPSDRAATAEIERLADDVRELRGEVERFRANEASFRAEIARTLGRIEGALGRTNGNGAPIRPNRPEGSNHEQRQ